MSTVLQLVKDGGPEVRIGSEVGANNNVANWGIPLGSTWPDANGSKRTAAWRVSASDGGVAFAAGEYRGALSRVLLTQANTADVTISGEVGQLKLYANSFAGIGNKAGVCGYLEMASGASIGGGAVAAGVWGRVDCPSGCTIAASQVLSAFGTGYNDLGGTHTGIAAVLHVGTPAAGVWDSLINVSSSSGVYSATVGSAASKYLTVSVDGTPYKIALYAVA